MISIRLTLAVLLAVGLCAQDAELDVDFAGDVEPVLRAKCHACHGEAIQTNGLRLDRKADALAGSHAGPVIVPGASGESRLVERITSSKDGFRMPPVGPGLTPDEINIVRAWIDNGAEWPDSSSSSEEAKTDLHWSFQPVRRPKEPEVKDRSWVRNPIDAFVLARLEAEGLKPSEEAGRRAAIRRLSLDITGLPPNREEVSLYLSDTRPGAYDRLVDRLLNSPHYGEKWSRPWLDLAHYADSDGYEKDNVRPWAWRYRQWLIEALNRDLPFDRFTTEQIAGDLVADASTDSRVATGFFRNTLTNREAGTDREEARFEQIVNRTNTYSTTWLGLTVGCAQCHNHKFDPLSQKEHYQLSAFFDSAMEATMDAPMPGELGPYLRALPEHEKRRSELLTKYEVPALEAEWEGFIQGALANPGESHEWDFALTSMRALFDHAERVLHTPSDRRTARQARRMTDYFISATGPNLGRDKEKLDRIKKELRKELKDLDAGFPLISQATVLVDDPQGRQSHIHLGGDWRRLGVEVQPGVPAVLPAMDSNGRATRLDLAHWTVSAENPLTSRVTVNRIWQELFGRGLVFTSDDFGTQGEPPSHPKLLDWLASEFMRNGWSQKELLRTIVTSATYRQSSHGRPELADIDPDNRLLARQGRLRLTAELVRDSALAVSGLLSDDIGGRSARPPQPKGVAELGYSTSSTKWTESQGADRYRRGLYIHFQRTTPYPQLMNFDEPDSNVACSRRERSNTPLQALNLLNDPVFFEAAQALAWRIENEAAGGFDDHLDYAFELCLARSPSDAERRHLRNYFDRQSTILAKEDNVTQGMNAWVGLSRVLLNMDEFITRE